MQERWGVLAPLMPLQSRQLSCYVQCHETAAPGSGHGHAEEALELGAAFDAIAESSANSLNPRGWTGIQKQNSFDLAIVGAHRKVVGQNGAKLT